MAEGACLHALLAQARQHIGYVGEVRLVRSDEEHAAAVVTESRVGVEEIGSAVQGDDGLPGAWTAVHDERAVRARADDGVLIRRDGGQYVAHPIGPAAA